MTPEHRGSLYLAAGSFLDVSAQQLVDIVLDLDGCAGIGLRLSGEHAIPDSGRARDIRSQLASRGRRVFDAEVVRVSNGFAAESARGLIERAVDVGAANVLAVSDLDDLDRSISAFASLADIARDHGIAVAVEYMAWTMPRDVDGALRVHAETGCRIVVDLVHHSRIGATANDLARLVGADVVAWIQICDAPRECEAESLLAEARHGRLIPGEGGLPIRDLVAAVPSHVAVSIEVQSDRLLDVDPRERARRLVDATRALLGRLEDV